MQALVYNGPGRKNVEDRPKPALAMPGDAIVRITRTTICGTDLHILKGDVPETRPGTTLGHEAVGTVVEVGAAVTTLSLWIKDVTITTGLVDTASTPTLLRMLGAGQLDVGRWSRTGSPSTTSKRPTGSSPTPRTPVPSRSS